MKVPQRLYATILQILKKYSIPTDQKVILVIKLKNSMNRNNTFNSEKIE